MTSIISSYSLVAICGRVFWDPRSSFNGAFGPERTYSPCVPMSVCCSQSRVTLLFNTQPRKTSDILFFLNFKFLSEFFFPQKKNWSFLNWIVKDPSSASQFEPIVLPGRDLMASIWVSIHLYYKGNWVRISVWTVANILPWSTSPAETHTGPNPGNCLEHTLSAHSELLLMCSFVISYHRCAISLQDGDGSGDSTFTVR